MTKWPMAVLAVALTGCFSIGGYRRPTIRSGGDVALSKPASAGEVIAKALLCSGNIVKDTSSTKSQACRAMPPADTTAAPIVPVRKP